MAELQTKTPSQGAKSDQIREAIDLLERLVVDGLKQIHALAIDPEVVSKDDVEMLQDLILAAINDAQRKVDEALQKQMGGLMGGLGLR